MVSDVEQHAKSRYYGYFRYTLGQIKEWVRNSQHGKEKTRFQKRPFPDYALSLLELETLSVRMHVRYHYAWAVKRYGYVDPPWHEPYEPSEVEHPRYIYVEEGDDVDEDDDPEGDEPQDGHDDEPVPAQPPKRFRSTSRSPPRRYVTLGGNVEVAESDEDGTQSDLGDEEDSSCAEDRRRHSPRRRLSPPHEAEDNLGNALRLHSHIPPTGPAVPLSSPGSSSSTSTIPKFAHSSNYEYINPYPQLKFTPTADWRPDPEAIVRARLDEMRVNGHHKARGSDRAERLENLDWRNSGSTTEKKKRKVMAPLAKPGERGLYAPRPGEPGVSAGGGR